MLAVRSALVKLLPLFVAGACAGPPMMGPILPEVPAEQAKCRVAASQSSPLVTEWPASEKANLEALLRTGGVAVSYSGCAMRVLPQCRLRGGYTWQRTTPSADILEINNADELYAKLPLGAASLEGELSRAGQLSVETYVSGQMRLENASVSDMPGEGECAQATHVVGALSVGAFTLSRGISTEARASAGVVKVGDASGRRSRSAGHVRSAGEPEMCASGTEQAPHPSCASPIQVFLWPIPGRVAEEGPPGTVKVDFVSASANGRWDVYVDDEVVCTTPCSRWVSPSRPVFLRTREDGFFRSPDKIRLSGLGPNAVGDVQLQAHGTATGKLATGITFTALGGTTALTGVMLTALGCRADGPGGMCKGGLISLGVGAVVTVGAIWMIFDAMPRAEVVPMFRASLGDRQPVVVRVGPGFVAGQF
jgi:hypothetical protein